MVNPAPERTVRFGRFEVDLATCELFKAGRKIDLERQPFVVLAMLLKARGELVTRDELQAALWPDGTFVDFDRGLNVAVKKLRDALGDSPGNPRFIETLSRRGYRFIAPVEGGRGPEKSEISEPQATGPRAWMWVSASVACLLGMAGLSYWQGGAFELSDVTALELKSVPLTAYPGFERSPALSPDGKYVAFSWNGEKEDNADIYLKRFDTGNPMRLTNNPAPDDMPAWSPDGGKIAFVRNGNTLHGRATIQVIATLGGPERKITQLASNRCYPYGTLSWSADGEWLAFADKNSPDDPYAIYIVSLETGERRRVTSPEARIYGDAVPVISPDGLRLAFVRFRDYIIGDVYVMPLSGGRPTRLTNDGAGHFGLSWTADSKELVFSSERAGDARLWRIRASGGTPQALLGISGSDAPRGVSQQGHRLVFSRNVSDQNVWRADVQREKLVRPPRKLSASTRDDTNPQPSPDGSRIAFVSNRSGSIEIWVSDSDGQNAVPVTSVGRGMNSWPAWSPNAQWIAFDSNISGNWDVYVVDAHGGNPRAITNSSAADSAPSWHRDGRWIVYQSNRSGRSEIWKIATDGGSPTQVTTGGGERPAVSHDGKYVYYARGEAVWRVPTAGGKEVVVLDPVPEAILARWGSTNEGLYFLASTNDRPTLKFFEFNSRRTSDVMPVEKPWAVAAIGVSPDGRWLVYNQTDLGGSDIMFVENFR